MGKHILQPLDPFKVDHAQLVALGARIFAVQVVQLIYDLAAKKGWRPPDVVKAIDAENTRRDFDNTCASHDYCDTNMALIYTMRILTGCKEFGAQGGTEYSFDLEDEIWNHAKRVGFWNLYRDITKD